MRIRAGYELAYECAQPTPMLLALRIHPSRRVDLLTDQVAALRPCGQAHDYIDAFGNICTRILAPRRPTTISTEFAIDDSGLPDDVAPDARQHDIGELPDDVLVYLLGSRYCDTDRLARLRLVDVRQHAARLGAGAGDLRLRARAHPLRLPARRLARAPPADGFHERAGVCRDFAHLAITLCRCMNIPARYCTGYLGDIGVPPVPDPMDFSAWFEVCLGGRWYTFDARHNTPRIGRILMAPAATPPTSRSRRASAPPRSRASRSSPTRSPYAAPHPLPGSQPETGVRPPARRRCRRRRAWPSSPRRCLRPTASRGP